MPRPLEFYTQNPAKRKPSPGGEGVTPFGVTDEVEGNSAVLTSGEALPPGV